MSRKSCNNFINENQELNEISESNWFITSKDLLMELKLLIKDYYAASFTEEDNFLKLSFVNGQTFLVSLQEEK